MDGLSRVTGAPVTIRFQGEDLFLDPITLQDYGAIEQHLLRLPRPNVMALAEEAVDQLNDRAQGKINKLLAEPFKDDSDKEAAVAKAKTISDTAKQRSEALLSRALDAAKKNNTIAQDEISGWIDSVAGLSFCLWLKLSQRYPGRFSLEDVSEIIGQYGEDQRAQLIKDRDQASGSDQLGNSTGPAPAATTTTTQDANHSQASPATTAPTGEGCSAN